MNLLVLEGCPSLLLGGQERSLYEVINGLSTYGYRITLAYENEGELVSKYKDKGIDTFKIKTRKLILKSIYSPKYILLFLYSILQVARYQLSSSTRWDAIYVNQHYDLTLACCLGMIYKIPVVCHLRLPPLPSLSRQSRWGLNRCKLLFANSKYVAEAYIKNGISDKKIMVIYNGIDIQRFSPSDNEHQHQLSKRDFRQILYLGRITPDKGIDTLIESVYIAQKTHHNIKLLIVGNVCGGPTATDDYLQSLMNKGKELLGHAIEFRKATPHVKNLYINADLVVLPSRWNEAFGRVIIEAMASATPCIATRVGGIPEILTGKFSKLLVEKNNSAEMASVILEVIDWRIMIPQLGSDCRAHVERTFGIEVMLEAINQGFKQLH